MNNTLRPAIIGLALLGGGACAGAGPTNVGPIAMGMNKSEYTTSLQISPTNCNTESTKKGPLFRLDLNNITVEGKTLCRDLRQNKSESVETIRVGEVSYDVIEAAVPLDEMLNGRGNKVISALGHGLTAIFLEDRLISLQIRSPNVTLETLVTKYGVPDEVDKRVSSEECQNRMGSKFSVDVGKVDTIWKNGSVRAILRIEKMPPQRTCTDGMTFSSYILEERERVNVIEDAIRKYRTAGSKAAAKHSPF